jgi:uncharacterized protein YndB with AHSA1/START domain
MKRRLLLALLLAAPVGARVTQSAPDSFVSSSEAVLPLPPDQVWTSLLAWSAWWDPAHSYSGAAGALDLQAEAGGAVMERWSGGSVRHAVVLSAMPPALLRLSGGFGPLQALPVVAVLDFSLKAQGNGTRLTMTYRVAGSAASRLDSLAAPVDAVMSAAFIRLVQYANTGDPAAK